MTDAVPAKHRTVSRALGLFKVNRLLACPETAPFGAQGLLLDQLRRSFTSGALLDRSLARQEGVSAAGVLDDVRLSGPTASR